MGSDVRALVNRGVYGTKNLALYGYTGNNPIIFRDPDGLAPTKVHGEMAFASATDIRVGFSEAAAREVAFANMSVDMPGQITMKGDEPPQTHPIRAIFTAGFWKSLFDDPAHATGDIHSMPVSSARVDDLVNKAVDAAMNGDIKGARSLLGQATHTAEDQPFHRGIGVIQHLILTILDKLTFGLFDLDPDKVTEEKRKAAVAGDISKVFTPFSERLRERAPSPEDADRLEKAVKGKGQD